MLKIFVYVNLCGDLPDQLLSWQTSDEEYSVVHYKYLHYKCWRCDSEYDVKCSPEINKTKLSSWLSMLFFIFIFFC